MLMIFEVPGVQTSMKNRSMKNQSKFEAPVGVPLGIDFSSMWGGVWKQVGVGNPTKIDQKTIQQGIEK